ncbi:argonaute 1 [Cladochytrium tenue]|nr:argonaute 1 [Cladochytrium tenue]
MSGRGGRGRGGGGRGRGGGGGGGGVPGAPGGGGRGQPPQPSAAGGAPAARPPSATGTAPQARPPSSAAVASTSSAPAPRPPRVSAPPPVREELPPFEPDETFKMERMRPRRPAAGTRGRKFPLLVNLFTIVVPSADAYHYDVAITPEAPPPINRRLIAEWKKIHFARSKSEDFKVIVYDGRKNIYAPRRLKFADGDSVTDKLALPGEDQDKDRMFTIAVKHVATVNMERLHRFLDDKGEGEAPRDALQVLDVVLKSRPADLFESVIRRTGGSFYEGYEPKFNISNGLNARNGWRQSLRPTYHDVLLNLDISTTCFYQHGPLPNVVAAFFNKSRIQDVNPRSFEPKSTEFQRLSKFLSSVNINITYRSSGRRKYKIRRLHKESAARANMTMEGDNAGKMAGKSMTIEKFFLSVHGIKLALPNLPLVECGTSKSVLIPMELCEILPNQRHLGKLSDAQTADVIKIAAVAPPDRQARIMKGRRS